MRVRPQRFVLGEALATKPLLDLLPAVADFLDGLLNGAAGFAGFLRFVPDLILLLTGDTRTILFASAGSLPLGCWHLIPPLCPKLQRKEKSKVPESGTVLAFKLGETPKLWRRKSASPVYQTAYFPEI
jgi:hypothetical protein